MKKKTMCAVIGGVVALSVGVGFYLGNNVSTLRGITKIPEGSGSMIAMYIQDEEGNYNLSDAQEFPKDGYVLNTEKSSCKNGGVISQNASTKALSLKVKTSDECTVYFDVVTSANPSADMLITKANDASVTTYSSGNKKEMYVFDHDELTTTTEYDRSTYTHSATQVADWTSEERRDYRYIGANPNNYITFNDETWRIIGVFTVETESGVKKPLMKIIRDQSLGNLAWDSNWNNEWSTSSLQKLLNGDYYNQVGSYTSTASVKGLSTTARSQIAKVKWYLGGSSTYHNLGGPDYYNFERGTKTCVTESTYCNGQTRTTSIIQNVGLMYPSDYVYTYAKGVNDTCYTDGYNCDKEIPSAGWLYNSAYQWFLSSYAALASDAFRVSSAGCVGSDNVVSRVSSAYGVRPTVFLDSEIAIKSGDGSQGNPYTLG